MSLRKALQARLSCIPKISLFDLLVGVVLIAGGLAYHWDFKRHSQGLVGDCPFGDAEFWWDGAVRVSEAQVQNHPGRGMRPGFFALAGLSIPVLGPAPATFHKFLLTLFSMSTLLLYLVLRDALGRLAALFGLALALFNPHTAQWLATPTTDGAGLVVHVLALGCLFLSVRRGSHRGWLAAFAILFALGSLTRPLMTPFIGVVVLWTLGRKERPWRGRLLAAATLLSAFCLPTCAWMAAQRALNNQWSLSDNDASAFYAASDPTIQVWNPAMYNAVADKARERFGTSAPTAARINQVFWSLTLRNYVKYARYHLDRILPNLWAVAAFPPHWAPADMARWHNTPLAGLAAALGLRLFARRLGRRAVPLFALACCLILLPQTFALLTLAGAVFAVVVRSGSGRNPTALLLALYWLCGATALYLTGGSIGSPVYPRVHLNALGYRLGAQVFFSGGILASYFLIQLSTLYLPVTAEGTDPTTDRGFLARAVDRFVHAPNLLAGRIVWMTFATAATVVVAVYTEGTVLAIRRGYVRRTTLPVAFPDPSVVVELYRKTDEEARGRTLPIAQDCERLYSLLAANGSGGAAGDVVVLGQLGPILWNLDNQERTLLRLHPQAFAAPSSRQKYPVFGQVPARLALVEWAGAQGAFILRRVPDCQDHHELPQYYNAPVLRGFVPLDSARGRYDPERTVWFPLDLYASQLVGTGHLRCCAGEFEWKPVLETGRGRRLAILPLKSTGNELTLRVDLTRLKRPTTLSFAYRWAIEAAGPKPPLSELSLRVHGVRRGTGARILLHADRETSVDAQQNRDLRAVRLDLERGDDLVGLELTWNSNSLPAPVHIYEMVLRLEELCP